MFIGKGRVRMLMLGWRVAVDKNAGAPDVVLRISFTYEIDQSPTAYLDRSSKIQGGCPRFVF